MRTCAGEVHAMASRQTVTSGTPWEPIVGYARAVRVANTIYVSGTTATDDTGAIVGRGYPYAQTRQALRNIERALIAASATMADVVRTRLFVINIDQWKEIARAHSEACSVIRQATRR